jgi:hypothetical protein
MNRYPEPVFCVSCFRLRSSSILQPAAALRFSFLFFSVAFCCTLHPLFISLRMNSSISAFIAAVRFSDLFHIFYSRCLFFSFLFLLPLFLLVICFRFLFRLYATTSLSPPPFLPLFILFFLSSFHFALVPFFFLPFFLPVVSLDGNGYITVHLGDLPLVRQAIASHAPFNPAVAMQYLSQTCDVLQLPSNITSIADVASGVCEICPITTVIRFSFFFLMFVPFLSLAFLPYLFAFPFLLCILSLFSIFVFKSCFTSPSFRFFYLGFHLSLISGFCLVWHSML